MAAGWGVGAWSSNSWGGLQNLTASVSESIAPSETQTSNVAFSDSVSESILPSESQSATIPILVSVSEIASINSLQIVSGTQYTATVFEVLAITETQFSRYFWEPISNQQTANWQNVPDAQTANWQNINNPQTASWSAVVTQE